MQEIEQKHSGNPDIANRANTLFDEMLSAIDRRTDKLFIGLMVFQWLTGIVVAVFLSPRHWAAGQGEIHHHLWNSIAIGGALTLAPIVVAFKNPGAPVTRHLIAIAQMLTVGLLIDLTGGQIETHFHYFGSLAFLAFYRDWRVLITASIVAAANHILMGTFSPESMYGVMAIEPWRWVEHIGWVVFVDFFLIISILQSLAEMRGIASNRARLENVNAEIEAEVSLRTAELREKGVELIAAEEAALAASRAKSEFLSSMSHEIRTPMNAILGMAQLLEETTLTTDQSKYLEIMTANGDVLMDLINGVLDLARIESGRLTLEHLPFDLETLTDRTVETLAVRAHQKGLEMLAHLMPDVPTWVVGDRLRIRQILLNLIGNAVKFTEKGQVLLNIERDRTSEQTDILHFSVADTGIGIAKDKLEEVFSNFTQADSSTTRKYGGSGLGLAIVRRLVDLMGGRVWVESELGRGSAFHFTARLPVQADGVEQRPSTMAISLSGVRALVVDDNFTNRFILREMLSSRGAEVDEAEDGPTALARIERAKTTGASYKLLLIDCRMPDMDGFEVAERVKDLGEPGLTVMMLSSDDLKVQQTRSHELGLDAYLVKPVSRVDLFEAIGTAMSLHSADSQLQLAANAATATSAPVDNTTSDARVDRDRPMTILLADDSTDNRLLVHAYLKDAAIYHLDDAENGAIALAKVKAARYDLVLMDIQMPVMDGLEATRAIRTWEHEEHRAPTPIIALTASALDEDVRRTLEAGVDMHVSKPIKKRVLVAAIKKSLRPRPLLTVVKKPADAAA